MRVLIKSFEEINLDNTCWIEFTAQLKSGKIIEVEDNLFESWCVKKRINHEVDFLIQAEESPNFASAVKYSLIIGFF